MDNNINVSDSELLKLIRHSDEQTLKRLFQQYKTPFIQWAKAYYDVDNPTTIAVFRQAFTIFYLNIKNEKVKVFVISVEKYLLYIGQIIFEKQGKTALKEVDELKDDFNINEINFNILEQHQERYSKLILKESIDGLEESVSRILKWNYFCNLPIDKIAQTLGYNEVATVANEKYRSLKTLIETANN